MKFASPAVTFAQTSLCDRHKACKPLWRWKRSGGDSRKISGAPLRDLVGHPSVLAGTKLRVNGESGAIFAPPTTEQAVIMLSSHFYESRDGSTGGFFADNVPAAQQVWNTVNLLLRLDRDWKV